jgi:elongation factor G
MKEYRSVDIRNVALVGHGTCGKTMISEAMLACCGQIDRMGGIATCNTISDYHDDEHERKISIQSSLLNGSWKNKKINIIDTPGYSDFYGETLGALRVADIAIIVVHANQGIEVGTENAWNHSSNYGDSKIIVINAMDKEYADFDKILQQAKDRFQNKVFPLTVPLNTGPGFSKILDILNEQVYTYKNDKSGQFTTEPATGKEKEMLENLHSQMSELIAESDDQLLEKFFATGRLEKSEIRLGLRNAVKNQSLIPIFCVSGETNVGISQVMDFLVEYEPGPVDKSKTKCLDENGEETFIDIANNEAVAFVFKTSSGAKAGDLSFFRVYSGGVTHGTSMYNSANKKIERIGQLFVLNGKNRTMVDHIYGGDIGAVVKLKDTHTNNTLCNEKKIITIPLIKYPNANISAAVTPKSKGDEEKMASGFMMLHEEDPTFSFKVDSELHQMLIEGQGELHLEVMSRRLQNRFHLEIEKNPPKIPYRETIKAKGNAKYRHRKQSGGAGQFAEVWMRIEPIDKDQPVEFTHSLVGQNVDRVFVPSVEKGVKQACQKGALAGYKVVAVKVDFYDGKQHPVDSKDIAFQIAGKFAFREAFMSAKPCLLEPIMDVQVRVPEKFMGDVMGDISSRRGKILGVDSHGSFQVVKAQVAQAELYRYSTTLRSLTGGRGIHTEKLSHYEEMPKDMEQRVVAASKKEEESLH